MKLATAAEMAAVDRCAAEHCGLTVSELMESAGRCTAAAVGLLLGSPAGRRVALFCGRGNNGGDGFVAARVLLEGGAIPLVYLVGAPEDLRSDARRAFDAARASGVEITACPDASALGAARESALGADLAVDALLGTGFVPPARELAAAAIRLVNSLGIPVLAVDIPSGLSADHGHVTGDAVMAAATVTFGYPKPGLVLHPGARHVGRLWLADIGFPATTESLVAGELNLATAREMAPHLGPRDPESHKGTHGHVVLVAGSPGLAGAAALAARGALRAGAGLVTAALPGSIAPPYLPGLPEAMLLPLPDDAAGTAGRTARALVHERLSRAGALAVGPGLSRSAGSSRLVRELCSLAETPLVLDADALYALAGAGPEAIAGRRTPAVLTPHPGEIALLLGTSAAAVQADRVAAARSCAERFHAVVVLKGSRTVVAPPGGSAWINPTGNPGMASGGMGDVLTGVVAAHLARGMSPLVAALLGVYLHGLAGDLAAAAVGPWGILASEVADRIPAAVRSLQDRDERGEDAKLTLLVP
jgi:NAD(P)H-hydrate epimerase